MNYIFALLPSVTCLGSQYYCCHLLFDVGVRGRHCPNGNIVLLDPALLR
jgi:hypothetical protein